MKLPLLATATLALVSMSVGAQAQAMPDHDLGAAKPPVPASKSVTVTYAGHTQAFTVEDLLKLPQVTVHVHNAHRSVDETYSGPLVSDVLAQVGLKPSKETEPLILHSSLVATATDHYFVLYSVAEAEPSFSTGQVIVAVMKSGQPDTEGGILQLINTLDAKPARWVHGLSGLIVTTLPQKK